MQRPFHFIAYELIGDVFSVRLQKPRIEDQHIDVMVQKPRQGDLLLVAAGQLSHGLLRRGAANTKPIDPWPGHRLLPGRKHERPGTKARKPRESEVQGDAAGGGQSLTFAILAEHAHPLRPALCGRCGPGRAGRAAPR